MQVRVLPGALDGLCPCLSMYTYKAKLVRIVDGDTVFLEVDLGFHLKATMDFRLVGLNTPEIVGVNKTAGLVAKAELERLLGLGPVTVKTQKSDKYGRWLADLYVQTGDQEVHVNQALLDGGFAKPYTGSGPKE